MSEQHEKIAIFDQEGLQSLQYWIFDFPQLEAFVRHDDGCASAASLRLEMLDDFEVVCNIIHIAEEICASNSSAGNPSSVEGAWNIIYNMARHVGNIDEKCIQKGFSSRESQYRILCALLCHAMSEKCEKRSDYIGRIVSMDNQNDVQRELMQIIQKNSNNDNDVDDDKPDTLDGAKDFQNNSSETDYKRDSRFSLDQSFDMKKARNWNEAFGSENWELESEHEKKRLSPGVDDSFFETMVERERITELERELRELRTTNTKLNQALIESRQQEDDSVAKIDQLKSQHRAEMLRLEAETLKLARESEDKHTNEISELKQNLNTFRDYKQCSIDLKEEVTRLRDELDVMQFSKDKLSLTEEQLRKCRERIEEMGDAQSALAREEKAHAASVAKCLELEDELAHLKPLKRQLDEYKTRADDAEVALTECRAELQHLREKSCGLEGVNKALKRGALLHQVETEDLQKRLQQEGGDNAGQRGTSVGTGMSELNPQLMEEVMSLRSENSRLREFASKREVDSVQRLEESLDDAERLSERFKEKFLRVRAELDDTQHLLRESEAREAKLKDDISDWAKRYKALSEEMKNERLKSQKAAIDAERNFQKQKQSLYDKARKNLRDSEDEFNSKLEAERKLQRDKLEKINAEMTEREALLTKQLTLLREQSSVTLRSNKEQLQRRIDELEKSKKVEVEKLTREKEQELEGLKVKGRKMLRDQKKKAEEARHQLVVDYEAKIEASDEELRSYKESQQAYEKKANAIIAKKTNQIQILEVKVGEYTRLTDGLGDKVKKAERTVKELTSENDRLRRQLGSRFGPGNDAQVHMEKLMSAYNSVMEENRSLKASNPDGLLLDKALSESTTTSDWVLTTATTNKSTLDQMREEYEEQLRTLLDEKRELVMRNSAAMTDVQKAEKRSWELEEELSRVKSELRATKLSRERNERYTDFSSGLSASSQKRYETPVNKENYKPGSNFRALPPSNAAKHLNDLPLQGIEDNIKKSGFTPISRRSSPATERSLLDFTSEKDTIIESQPECRQS